MFWKVTTPNKDFTTGDRSAPRCGVQFVNGLAYVDDALTQRVSDKEGPTHFTELNVLKRLRDEFGYHCEPVEPGEVVLERPLVGSAQEAQRKLPPVPTRKE